MIQTVKKKSSAALHEVLSCAVYSLYAPQGSFTHALHWIPFEQLEILKLRGAQ